MVYIRITSDVLHDDIYYTLDGTDPTRESLKYTDPFPLYNSCEVRAISVKDEWLDSDVSSLWVDVAAATPVIVRKDGTASDNCFIEVINREDYENAENVRFYYTLNGDEPTVESDSFAFGGSLNVKENCTVKLIAGGDKNIVSPGTVEIRVEDLKCQLPQISSRYSSEDRAVWVTLTSPTEGANIYYTTDGSVPGNESYLYGGRFSICENCTLKVAADTDTLLISDVAEEYILVKLVTPSLSVSEDKTLVSIVNLGSYESDTIFYYTLDGTDPSVTSNIYNKNTGIPVEEGMEVRAVASGSQGRLSDIAKITVPYTYYLVEFDSDGGTPILSQSVKKGSVAKEPLAPEKADHEFKYWYLTDSSVPYDFNTPVVENITLHAYYETLIIRTPTPVVTVYYPDGFISKDGKIGSVNARVRLENKADYNPDTTIINLRFLKLYGFTEETAPPMIKTLFNLGDFPYTTLVGTAIEIPHLCIVEVKFKDGDKEWSETIEVAFDQFKMATPELTVEGSQVSINDYIEGYIYTYTTDGTDPTEQSAKYTEPFSVTNAPCTVKVINWGKIIDDSITYTYANPSDIAEVQVEAASNRGQLG